MFGLPHRIKRTPEQEQLHRERWIAALALILVAGIMALAVWLSMMSEAVPMNIYDPPMFY